MTSAVCNASPLIALSVLHQFSLLTTLFDAIVVPDAVVREVAQESDLHGALEVRQGLDSGALTGYTIQAPIVVERLYGRLHRGELEVIIGAVELGISRVILDDRSARQFAIADGLHPTGTLGVLLLAREAGLIPALKTPLDALRESGFRISETLYREALRQVGE